MVEEHADEWDGHDTSKWQGDVEETVKSICGLIGSQQVGVLGVDGGDEVVQSEHLDGGEETDELEPPRVELV